LGVTASGVITGNTLPSPVSIEGSLFYKSDTDVFYVSDGSAWNLVSNASPATTGGTVTIATINEGGSFNYNIGIDFTDDVDTDGQLIYTLVSGTLPSGCVLPTTGNSSFTGTASGVASNTSYTWSIKVTDTSGGTATQNYQQQINNVPPSFVSPAPGNLGAHFDSNRSVSYTFNATSSLGESITFSVSSGDIPIGTALNGSTGVLSGTAGAVESDTTSSFVIRATESAGGYIDRSYDITIKAPVAINFSYSSRANQSWSVPTGVTQFTVRLWGGGGSAGTNGSGSAGGGGYSWAKIDTQAGAIFKLWIPESGVGTDQNGGGGGYAKIVYSSETDANTVAVAGGGGGFGTNQTAGQGGGATTTTTDQYYGASQTSGGAASSCAGACTSGGTPPFGFFTCAGAHWQGGHGAGGENDVKGWSGGWPGGGSAGGGNGCNGAGAGGGWYGGGNGGDRGGNGASAAGGTGYVAGVTSGSSNISGAQCTVVTGGSDGGGQTGNPANYDTSNYYPGGGIAYGANTGGYWGGNGPGHVAGKGYIVIVY
jgi:hypothetical protein